MDNVWVFNGGGSLPSAVFTRRDLAVRWIAQHKLTGVLTSYPLDVAVYDWAVASGVFKPQRPDQSEPRFIGRFSSASLEHYHYEAGAELGAAPGGDGM